jgi:hypothetical protein
MRAVAHHDIDRVSVLSEALLNVGKCLDLSQAELGSIIGKDRSAVSRGRIDPLSKSGEIALLFIRCYRALYVLVGGDDHLIRHWMNTHNLHTGGVPLEQVKSIQGLVSVLEYLDAIRGKI